ncbi:protein kinase [Anaeramoeba flamelloides]|uniref:Protein kinase n=1 Tax=Anaeramoeba flamelloides TaxID=1746091 RepID=A0AAV8AFR3_9EUKA|nr:protein kinase [Anaeramoeba flamelloides]
MKAKYVGNYLMGKTLGVGATGKVKLGTHKETNKKVAIKILPKKFFKKKNLKEKLEREVSILKLLKHPNVMRLYDVYETSKTLYLIMELAEGGELFDYLISNHKLSHPHALFYFQQLILALSYMHERKICHRDLKPENLLLDKDLNLKIADFGMAQLMKDGSLLETSCGSPHYASPEVIKGVNYDGRKADIWGCGVVLFTILSGRLPFDSKNIQKLLSKIKNGDYQMSSSFNELEKDIIRKILRVNPINRISMKEIKNHPFFTSNYPIGYTPPNSQIKIELIGKIEKKKIDHELINNLQTLGWGNQKKIINYLQKKDLNQVKIFYSMYYKKKYGVSINRIMNNNNSLLQKKSKKGHKFRRSSVQKIKRGGKKKKRRRKTFPKSLSPLTQDSENSDLISNSQNNDNSNINSSNSNNIQSNSTKNSAKVLNFSVENENEQFDDMNHILFQTEDELPFLDILDDNTNKTTGSSSSNNNVNNDNKNKNKNKDKNKTKKKKKKKKKNKHKHITIQIQTEKNNHSKKKTPHSLKYNKTNGKNRLKKKFSLSPTIFSSPISIEVNNNTENKNDISEIGTPRFHRIKYNHSPNIQLSLSPKQSWFNNFFRKKSSQNIVPNLDETDENINNSEEQNFSTLLNNTLPKPSPINKTCKLFNLQVITKIQNILTKMNINWIFPSVSTIEANATNMTFLIKFEYLFVSHLTKISFCYKNGDVNEFNSVCNQLLDETLIQFD